MIQRIDDMRMAGRTSEEIIDALLPQVNTVGKLESLPQWTWLTVGLLKGYGWMFRWNGAVLVDIESGNQADIEWLVERYGPLTVVWTPDGAK